MRCFREPSYESVQVRLFRERRHLHELDHVYGRRNDLVSYVRSELKEIRTIKRQMQAGSRGQMHGNLMYLDFALEPNLQILQFILFVTLDILLAVSNRCYGSTVSMPLAA